ncbi:virginiamycin B lyase family protein [Tsukamurella pseudospumae]|uniref:Virginiamycin B lyase n=1 Tax=Tsukamurella pseudospumae TaxID=239498 RepID=A0A138AJX0_9ACTN|nr:hypothetical protein [Tsukamurella pseudospumae]KXP10808.1 hypothetical protein AXK60_05880 [Tsukamurella pseudospumae]
MSITIHDVPGSGPYALTAGPDGGLWFTLVGSGEVGRYDVETGETALYPVGPDAGPTIIVPGPDGALWFTEIGAGRIGRMTPDGAVTHVPPRRPRRTAPRHLRRTGRPDVVHGMGRERGRIGGFGGANPQVRATDARRGAARDRPRPRRCVVGRAGGRVARAAGPSTAMM